MNGNTVKTPDTKLALMKNLFNASNHILFVTVTGEMPDHFA